ncbi:MAG: hypothetical protein LBV36_08420 [Chromatiales bacterium]|jgi:flagellar biosynthesis/type III secretory pathway M-ring protein FliF/YscJ|nr:hypothetical protein [Chromatiales bacterium]
MIDGWGGIFFKIVLILLLAMVALFMWIGDRRIRREREAEDRAALEAEQRRRMGGDSH